MSRTVREGEKMGVLDTFLTHLQAAMSCLANYLFIYLFSIQNKFDNFYEFITIIQLILKWKVDSKPVGYTP